MSASLETRPCALPFRAVPDQDETPGRSPPQQAPPRSPRPRRRARSSAPRSSSRRPPAAAPSRAAGPRPAAGERPSPPPSRSATTGAAFTLPRSIFSLASATESPTSTAHEGRHHQVAGGAERRQRRGEQLEESLAGLDEGGAPDRRGGGRGVPSPAERRQQGPQMDPGHLAPGDERHPLALAEDGHQELESVQLEASAHQRRELLDIDAQLERDDPEADARAAGGSPSPRPDGSAPTGGRRRESAG